MRLETISERIIMSPPLAPRLPHAAPRIMVFDSGLGGLTVEREIAAARPDAEIVYVADDAAFPYGALGDGALIERVLDIVGRMIASYRPDLCVIACNTASTLVLPALRQRHAIPFIGTVPAVKPACAASLSRMVSVLATPGTVRRDYTQALIAEHAGDCDVTLVGSPHLAGLAEAHLTGVAIDDREVLAEIAPCFIERDGRRTDTVVLACTHYPLLVEAFQRVAPWPVSFIDPAPAIARRVMHFVGAMPGRVVDGHRRAVFTAGRRLGPALHGALSRRAIDEAVVTPLPLAVRV